MITIYIVDDSARARNALVDRVNVYLNTDAAKLDILPRITLRPLSVQELKFHAAPDLCIVGRELLNRDLPELAKLRKLIPSTSIIAELDDTVPSFSKVEQLARMGADDTISTDTSTQEFIRKLILLCRRSKKESQSKLILVDSGKGGVGTTSVVAGLGEALFEQNNNVILVDFDFETQDLSRFLQARPFINENLQLLFDKDRVINTEYVEQCLTPVWQSDVTLRCMSPIAESDLLYSSEGDYPRILLSIFEVLDALADCIVVDLGSTRGQMLKTLYRIADKVVMLVDNDPATLYATASHLNKVRGLLSPACTVTMLENASPRNGLPGSFFRKELSQACELDSGSWAETSIPFCRHATRWPGSGFTINSMGKSAVKKALKELLFTLDLAERPDKKNNFLSLRVKKSKALTNFDSKSVSDLDSIQNKQLTFKDNQPQEALPMPEDSTVIQEAKHRERGSELRVEDLISGAKFS